MKIGMALPHPSNYPQYVAIKKKHVPKWLFFLAVKYKWSIFYETYPRMS